MLRTMLIGDNAFIGVSHLSQARARDRIERLNVDDMVKVIQKALSCGATGYTFSTHPTNYEILKTMKRDPPAARFEICPVMPYAEGYVRIANEKGMLGLIMDMMSRLSIGGKAKALLQGGLSALSLDPIKMLQAYVDVELATCLSNKPDNAEVKSVFLHEVITDVAVSFRLKELVTAYMGHLRDKFSIKPGFVTRNFAKFHDFFQEIGIPWNQVAVMTPFNKIGFQMTPAKEACEARLGQMLGAEVIAMSLLAGGLLQLSEGIEYVKSLPNLTGVTVGASTQEHAESTFSILGALH